jgi:hypothetical protein
MQIDNHPRNSFTWCHARKSGGVGLLPTEPEFERAERLWLMRSRLNAAAAPNLSHNNRLEVS